MEPLGAPSAAFEDAKRIVVKVGSALLVNTDGQIRREWLTSLAQDLCQLMAQGKEILLVSSGAIAVGRLHLGLKASGPLRLGEKQAAAATGQIQLAHAYQEAMAAHQRSIAQILITAEDTEQRERHLNARATLLALLSLGVLPVINENDTVATAEIRYGDNDRLAARVASMIQADLLVLLSDIDGLYTANPKTDPSAKHLPHVTSITTEIEAMAGEPLPGYSSGGMVTKIAAAKLAVQAGCSMIIAKGEPLNPLKVLRQGAPATLFKAKENPLKARQTWIAGALQLKGALVLDQGAVSAVVSGKSLLPIGVKEVRGNFDVGDAVSILSPDAQELGRGLIAYGSEEACKIAGCHSSQLEVILGHQGRSAIVHADDLVITVKKV